MRNNHWTAESIENYLYSVSFGFVAQLENALESSALTHRELSERLGVTEARVSQLLNSPGNLTLKSMVKLARSLDRKMGIVFYDDSDHANAHGPIDPEIFVACWENAGCPRELRETRDSDDEVQRVSANGWSSFREHEVCDSSAA